MASVRYWTVNSYVKTAQDFRTTPGITHLVNLYGLQPDTKYQYEIRLEDTAVYTMTIDTYKSWPLTTPQMGFGRIHKEGSPISGVLVRIYVRQNNPLKTIIRTLLATTNDSGYWSVDLSGNATSSSVIGQGGDPVPLVLDIEALDGLGNEAHAFSIPLDYKWPLESALKPLVQRQITLGTGYNSFALPIYPRWSLKVSDVARLMPNQVESVYKFNGTWSGAIISGTTVLGDDFSFVPGEGYFLRMKSAGTFILEGLEFGETFPLYLVIGWNLISAPYPAKLSAYDLSDATGVISGTTTYNVSEIDRWAYGRHEGHISGYPFNNFPIEPDRAYFIRANRTGQLDSGTGFTLVH